MKEKKIKNMQNKIQKNKIQFVLLTIMAAFLMLSPISTVSARGFSGGHSTGHSSYSGGHTTYGGGHSTYHYSGGTSTRSNPSTFKSYHSSSSTTSPKTYKTKPDTSNSRKNYTVRRSTNSNRTNSNRTTVNNHYYGSNNRSYSSEFGHSIVRGAGFAVGANMGNSFWHQTFGFGGDRYYGSNNQVMYAHPGYGGWIILLPILIIIGIIIFIKIRNRNNHHY